MFFGFRWLEVPKGKCLDLRIFLLTRGPSSIGTRLYYIQNHAPVLIDSCTLLRSTQKPRAQTGTAQCGTGLWTLICAQYALYSGHWALSSGTHCTAVRKRDEGRGTGHWLPQSLAVLR